MMKVYPPPTLEMLIIDQTPDDHYARDGYGISGGMVRISLTTHWDKGTVCDICGEEIAIDSVWIEHLEGGCTQEPCPHGIENLHDNMGYECALMRHDKAHFRHLSSSFSCLPEEAQARARVHWKGCI